MQDIHCVTNSVDLVDSTTASVFLLGVLLIQSDLQRSVHEVMTLVKETELSQEWGSGRSANIRTCTTKMAALATFSSHDLGSDCTGSFFLISNPSFPKEFEFIVVPFSIAIIQQYSS